MCNMDSYYICTRFIVWLAYRCSRKEVKRMSKYNVGDKFVIEITKNDTTELDNTEYYITNARKIFEKEELDRLQKYEEEQIPYSEAYNKGLEDGRNEVWELANKLNNMTMQDIINIYGFCLCRDEVFEAITPQEALEKLEAYEKKQEKARQKIMVGDIVALEDGIKGVVMDEDGVDNVVIFTENGCIEAWMNKKYITKTGKHIDIQSVLEQIKE